LRLYNLSRGESLSPPYVTVRPTNPHERRLPHPLRTCTNLKVQFHGVACPSDNVSCTQSAYGLPHDKNWCDNQSTSRLLGTNKIYLRRMFQHAQWLWHTSAMLVAHDTRYPMIVYF